jgi:hypothetical protein
MTVAMKSRFVEAYWISEPTAVPQAAASMTMSPAREDLVVDGFELATPSRGIQPGEQQ